MTREQVANHMNNRHPDPNTMYQVVHSYHKDVLKEDWNPHQIDIRILERMYNDALTGLSRHHGVHLLYSKEVKGQRTFIKAF
jgi:hypothetical protein